MEISLYILDPESEFDRTRQKKSMLSVILLMQ